MTLQNATTQFKDLFGKECAFYGISQLRFKLNERVWKAIPTDDFVVEAVEPVPEEAFFPDPLALVKVGLVHTDEFNGWQLVDAASGHRWLAFGENAEESRLRWQFNFCFAQKQLNKYSELFKAV